MICNRHTLIRALDSYRKYMPTASEHLRRTREVWIPVHLFQKFNLTSVPALMPVFVKIRSHWN